MYERITMSTLIGNFVQKSKILFWSMIAICLLAHVVLADDQAGQTSFSPGSIQVDVKVLATKLDESDRRLSERINDEISRTGIWIGVLASSLGGGLLAGAALILWLHNQVRKETEKRIKDSLSALNSDLLTNWSTTEPKLDLSIRKLSEFEKLIEWNAHAADTLAKKVVAAQDQVTLSNTISNYAAACRTCWNFAQETDLAINKGIDELRSFPVVAEVLVYFPNYKSMLKSVLRDKKKLGQKTRSKIEGFLNDIH
jgi:hypothetical protein